MKAVLFCVAIISMLASCRKEDSLKDKDGVVISQPPIWATATTDDDQRANNFLVETKVTNNNNLLISSKKNGKNLIRNLNIENGTTIWDWNEYLPKSKVSIRSFDKTDNRLTFFDYHYVYQVDINTGKTIISRDQYETFFELNSVGDKIFTDYPYNKDGAFIDGGYVAVVDKKTLNIVDKFRPKYDTTGTIPFDDGGYAFTAYGVPFEKNGDILVAVKSNDPANQRGMVGNQWLGLYNYSKKQWIYERQSIQKQSTWGAGLIYLSNDKVFTYSVGWVACHDLMTGQQLWKTVGSNGGGYLFAGLLIANGKVYANNDSGQLACFEISSGRKLWDIRSSGSSTELSYLNGVVYFVGGGDGKLHAIDAETGDYLWKIVSPDLSKNKSAVFSGLCAVIAGKGSEKGKVVVLNGLNAYCYEAIR